MRRLILTAAVLVIGPNFVRADRGCCKPVDCCAACDCVPLVCRPVFKTVPVTKACFDVECKEICIPKVTLPWHKCCRQPESRCPPAVFGTAYNRQPSADDRLPGKPPLRRPECGRVIAVNTLKIREYECGEKCVCVWHVEPAGRAGDCKPECSQPQFEEIPLPAPSAPPAEEE